ncbi:MAG: hypothetical protein ACI4O3_04330 [Oscillospiraceae bacterium]
MKDKRRSRLVEWGKNLLILLLALSALYLLGRTQFSGGIADSIRGLLGHSQTDADPAYPQASSVTVHPVRLAIYRDGRRYGVQYDQEETDAAFSSLSTLLSEALGSAGAPEPVSERDWRSALCRTGIYMDFLYPVPLRTLSDWMGEGAGNTALTGTARRICLAADEDGGVSLFYINEGDGSYYSCGTTLTRDFHLNAAVADWSPNGAMFAFEVADMDALAPYTLLTATPQPAVYAAGNPLLEDGARVTELLNTLTFQPQGTALDPAAGGQLVEGNDSLRLSSSGVVTFHTIGDSGFRFPLPEDSTQGALDYVQALAETTVGAWCGQARLCLAGVEETADGLEITYQYSLNGAPVALPEDYAAARFVISGGAVTDFTLYLRSYTDTGETSVVLPEVQAAAAMNALDARGKELTLLYQDSGGTLVSAGWIAA